MIPLIGEPADGVNSLLYAYEEDYVNAGLTSAAMIPFVGWGATTTKWSRNILKYSNNAFHSASGLVFKTGSKHGNRLSHVLAHTSNDLKKLYHSVFDGGKDGVIGTIDEAWDMAQKGENLVSKTINSSNGNVEYIVEMGRRVGYEGGKKGSGESLTKVKIVIEKGSKSDVVTAFPFK